METDREWILRDMDAYRAWKADPANAGKKDRERVKLTKLRGGVGMKTRESSTNFSLRQKEEKDAFETSELGLANESLAAYNARVAAAKTEYMNRPVGAVGATGATGATEAGGVVSTDRMAKKLTQKTARSRARPSGRSMLRIGR
jgi:hypothetical protein